MEVLTATKCDSLRSILHVTKRQTALTFMVFVGLCGVAQAADHEWAHIARQIIVTWDGIERQMISFCERKPPANASQEYMKAWREVMWKAGKVRWLCNDIVKCAEILQKIIERGGEPKRTIEELFDLIHKYKLAWNEFEQALRELQRIQRVGS